MILTYIPDVEANSDELLREVRHFVKIGDRRSSKRIDDMVYELCSIKLMSNEELGNYVATRNEKILICARRIRRLILKYNPEDKFKDYPLDERGTYIGADHPHGSDDDWQIREVQREAEKFLDRDDITENHRASMELQLEGLLSEKRIFQIFQRNKRLSLQAAIQLIESLAIKREAEVFVDPYGTGHFATTDPDFLNNLEQHFCEKGLIPVDPTEFDLPPPDEDSFIEKLDLIQPQSSIMFTPSSIAGG